MFCINNSYFINKLFILRIFYEKIANMELTDDEEKIDMNLAQLNEFLLANYINQESSKPIAKKSVWDQKKHKFIQISSKVTNKINAKSNSYTRYFDVIAALLLIIALSILYWEDVRIILTYALRLLVVWVSFEVFSNSF